MVPLPSFAAPREVELWECIREAVGVGRGWGAVLSAKRTLQGAVMNLAMLIFFSLFFSVLCEI